MVHDYDMPTAIDLESLLMAHNLEDVMRVARAIGYALPEEAEERLSNLPTEPCAEFAL
jgi:hypothetical protein